MPASTEPAADAPSDSPARAVLWAVAVAAVVRLLYFAESARSPLFTFPVLDEAYYDALGRALAGGGDVRGLDPGFRPLLYGALLAVARLVAGDGGAVLAKALQHLAGLATAGCVAWLAARLARRTAAGVVAGVLYALAGPPLFYEGQLLPDSLFALAVVVATLLAARSSTAAGGVAGTVVGIASQLRANGLAFLAVFPLFALRDPSRRWRVALVAVGGAIGVVLLVAILQRSATGHFQLVPSAGGVNLYLGNERGADGMFPRQDRPGTYGDAYRDSVEVFAAAEYRVAHPEDATPAPSAISRYWTARAVDEVRADPVRWLRLMVRKSWLLLWHREVANNLGYDFVRRAESPLLRALPVRWWMLLALVPMGVVAGWRGDRRLLASVAAFGLIQAATTVAFFVNGRYRLPLWPLAAALAGAGAVALVDAARARAASRGVLAAIVAGLVLASLSLADLVAIPRDSDARDVYYRSLAHLAAGNPAAALADVEASLELDPEEPAAHLQRGLALLALDRPTDALAELDDVVRRRPEEPRGHNARGIALERLGRDADAYRAYRAAIATPTGFAPAALNASLLALRAGRLAEAAALLAQPHDEQAVALWVARAELARRRGDPAASGLLERARALDAEATERLLADLARPATLDRPD